MQIGKIYRDKDIKNISLRVVEVKESGWIVVTFNHKSIKPKTYNYHQSYIDTFYEPVAQE